MRTIVRTAGSVLGVQVIVLFIAALVMASFRRSAGDWVLPLLAVADLVITVQIIVNAVRQ